MAKPKFAAQAAGIAAKYGIPQSIFFNLIQHESSWVPNAVSSAGAIGLTQLMPDTARGLKVNPWNPAQNMDGGARYLRDQYQHFKRWDLALAAYGWGPGAVESAGGKVPSAARGYVNYVLKGFSGQTPAPTTGKSAPLSTAFDPGLAPSTGPLPYSGPTDLSWGLGGKGFKGHGFHVSPVDTSGFADLFAAPVGPPAGLTGPSTPVGGGADATSTKYVKGEILLPTHFKATHDTDGIDGYQPSIDITTLNGKKVVPWMPVGAPEDGVIYRHGSAQGGDALYFRGRSGREYWIGHITKAGAIGSHYVKGGVIAYVSPQGPGGPIPHVHIGILRG